MSYYSKMTTEAFQVILKYDAPDQEDIVIQNVCKKLSFASNDPEDRGWLNDWSTEWSLSTEKW